MRGAIITGALPPDFHRSANAPGAWGDFSGVETQIVTRELEDSRV
jgi:hypothetical protein